MSRALAHIETVAWEKEIPNADNIKLIGVLGWQLIANKAEIQVNDKVVYIEIDSLAPSDDERFKFLESKHYKIKTMKLGAKLGSPISQGLAMPLSLFPELGDPDVGTDVTEQLKITYYSADDRQRKSNKPNKEAKYERMMKRLHATHPKIANSKIVRKLAKNKKWGMKILFFFFGKKKDLPKQFPEFISKSDQNRVENEPWLLKDRDTRWERSCKLDGTSCSFGVKRLKGNKWDYAVCSRNVRQTDPDEIPYGEFNTNVYIEMSEKYHIKDILIQYATENDLDTLYIQGECIGETVQGNPYKLQGRDLFLFELVTNGNKHSYQEIAEFADRFGMKHVPIIDTDYQLPETMEEMKQTAEGMSVINPQVKREGIVYRKIDEPWITFKNVANSYLLRKERIKR